MCPAYPVLILPRRGCKDSLLCVSVCGRAYVCKLRFCSFSCWLITAGCIPRTCVGPCEVRRIPMSVCWRNAQSEVPKLLEVNVKGGAVGEPKAVVGILALPIGPADWGMPRPLLLGPRGWQGCGTNFSPKGPVTSSRPSRDLSNSRTNHKKLDTKANIRKHPKRVLHWEIIMKFDHFGVVQFHILTEQR